jgi:hypothetical protein
MSLLVSILLPPASSVTLQPLIRSPPEVDPVVVTVWICTLEILGSDLLRDTGYPKVHIVPPSPALVLSNDI